MVIGGPCDSVVHDGGDTFDYGAVPPAVRARVQSMQAICAAHGVPLPAAALRFPLGHPVVKSIIPGPRTPAELAQILDWWNRDIPADLWAELTAAGLLRADAPLPTGGSDR